MIIENAQVHMASLGIERGILTSTIHLRFCRYPDGGPVQGFGGRVLSGEFCAAWVEKVLEVCGVDDWGSVEGAHVRTVREDRPQSNIKAMGHIMKDLWLDLREPPWGGGS